MYCHIGATEYNLYSAASMEALRERLAGRFNGISLTNFYGSRLRSNDSLDCGSVTIEADKESLDAEIQTIKDMLAECNVVSGDKYNTFKNIYPWNKLDTGDKQSIFYYTGQAGSSTQNSTIQLQGNKASYILDPAASSSNVFSVGIQRDNGKMIFESTIGLCSIKDLSFDNFK